MQRAALDPLDHPFADLGNDQDRPHPLQRGCRHRRSSETERQTRLRRIIDAAGAGDADLAIADIGLGHQHALFVGVETHADGDAVEYQGLFAVIPRQYDGSATETQLPVGHAVVGRLQMSQQRHPVLPRDDLERRNQHAASGIPFDADFRLVDRHRIIGRIGIDDVAGAGGQFAPEIGWQAVAAQFAFEFAGERQIRAIGEVLQPQRQQDICRRHLVGANVDRSHAVGGRSNQHPQRPGVAALLAHAQRHTAAARPAQTEADVFEIPFVAALLIVDDEIAVLQTDFVEVLSVKSGQAQTVEPVEAGKQSALRILGGRGSGWSGR